jgi:L-threonylcarbamoyladenylate synthase
MDKDVLSAAEVLKRGGLIVYPTDTIWGIGCDATNQDAVRKIYALKHREDQKSMLILLDDFNKLPEYIAEVPEIAADLVQVADKPLTIIYPGARNLAPNLIASDGSIGIRIVHDEFCLRLIRKFGKPVVSTSANISGSSWPVNFSAIDKRILDQADYTVSWGQKINKKATPSGIIKLGLRGEVSVIRE